MKRNTLLILILLAVSSSLHAKGFTLSSGEIKANATITDEQVFNDFGCTGSNVSPSLSWSGAPLAPRALPSWSMIRMH